MSSLLVRQTWGAELAKRGALRSEAVVSGSRFHAAQAILPSLLQLPVSLLGDDRAEREPRRTATATAFSECGGLLALGCNDGAVALLDSSGLSLRPLQAFFAHRGPVGAVAVDAVARVALTAGAID